MRYQLSINKYKNVDEEQFKDTKTFIVYSTNMNDIYRNTDKCNPCAKKKNNNCCQCCGYRRAQL